MMTWKKTVTWPFWGVHGDQDLIHQGELSGYPKWQGHCGTSSLRGYKWARLSSWGWMAPDSVLNAHEMTSNTGKDLSKGKTNTMLDSAQKNSKINHFSILPIRS